MLDRWDIKKIISEVVPIPLGYSITSVDSSIGLPQENKLFLLASHEGSVVEIGGKHSTFSLYKGKEDLMAKIRLCQEGVTVQNDTSSQLSVSGRVPGMNVVGWNQRILDYNDGYVWEFPPYDRIVIGLPQPNPLFVIEKFYIK